MVIDIKETIVEIKANKGKVFYNKETGDMFEGTCISTKYYSDEILDEYEDMEMDEAAAEELAAAFLKEQEAHKQEEE